MKSVVSSFLRKAAWKNIIILAVLLLNVTFIYSQGSKVTGRVVDEKSNQPVSYASIALFETAGSKPVTGALSDMDGQFICGPVPVGSYRVVASFLGYRSTTKSIQVTQNSNADAGIMQLQDSVIALGDAIVVGEKAKAKNEGNKTTFFVSQKMIDASGTGIDILKLIPGLQVDLMQNIYVEGSRDIVIYIDGKERDRNYVSQLSPEQIDKIEIISVPTANYDGNISKALNIILKKKSDSGFSGQVYSEIPVTRSIIYIFPSFSMNYGYKKINLYASYKGEIAYMDLHESLYREVWYNSDTGKYISNQYVRQKNQNHRFSYGFDYFISDSDVLNFYAYSNPYYMEFRGTAGLEANGTVKDSWQADKDDKFNSTTNFYSLFYKHSFEKTGSELTIDMSGNKLTARNSTAYFNDETTGNNDSLSSTTQPGQKGLSVKIDYRVPFGKKMVINAGVKAFDKRLKDNYSPDFRYSETVLASYGSLSYKPASYEITAGLRVEKSFTELTGSYDGSLLSFLPDAVFRYKIGTHQNLLVSYKRTIRRPDIYQLNPLISYDDPITIRTGNSYLKPELSDNINLEYSLQAGNNYFSAKIIYLAMKDVINNMTIVNENGRFEIQPGNLGKIKRYGFQFTGAFKIGNLSLNPYLLLYKNISSVNNNANQYMIDSRKEICLASSISAVLSFKRDFALSSVLQYNSPQNNMQDNYFCDALYFVSFDKTFKKKIKVGLGSGIMFTRSFIYKASDIDDHNFRSRYRGFVTIPSVPLWLRISYQFNTGKVKKKLDLNREEVNVKPGKGF